MNKDIKIERGLISKVLETKNFAYLQEKQIRDSFFSGENFNAFSFIQDNVVERGEVPTVRVFKNKFPNYNLDTYINENDKEVVGTEESLEYWCEEIRLKKKHNTLVETVGKVANSLKELETEEAYNFLKKQISFIENEVIESKDVDITKDTLIRKQKYLEKKRNSGMRGISFGFNSLDRMVMGIENGTLTTIVGKSGIGKSWFEIIVGAKCMLQNYSVLQLITEMSEDIMRDRYEAILFSQCYGSFRYKDFKAGKLDRKKEKEFFNFLEEDLPNFEPLNIATATGVIGVEASIEKYNPDVIFIDGVYLMEDDRGAKDDWLRISNITRDLKKLAKKAKKPIIINTQLDGKRKSSTPDLAGIMYSQSLQQDSDNVFALFRDEVMRSENEMGIYMLKNREGNLGKCVLEWNFDEMSFKDIYSMSDTEDEEEIEDNTIELE